MSSYAVILPSGERRETNDPEEFGKLCDLLEEREREYDTEENDG